MIPLCIPEIRGNEWRYIKECLDTNWVSSAGKYVDLFEDKFKEYVGTRKAVATVNGTSAIHLALRVLNIGPEDEVIVPSMTFIASVNPILYVGAKPVFVDVCRDTCVMDVSKIEELITEKTKAILPVHIYGHPVDMEPLINLAKKHNLYVIEDATEALGSEYRTSDSLWHKVGSMGDIGCFSFNGNKLITTGSGGMMVTNNTELGEKARFLSTQAKTVDDDKRFIHTEIGYNFRMPNILAAMGCAQIEKIDEYINIKRENAIFYNKLLKATKGITIPVEKEWAKSVNWLYSIVLEDEYIINRDELMKKLADNGIESRPFFMPVHKMIPYKEYKHGDLTYTNQLANRGINLPSSVGLRKDEIEIICKSIKNV